MQGPTRGFTLVEVLVALLAMALLAAMAWQGVDVIVRSREIGQGQVERTLRLGTVLAQWEQDLAALEDWSAVPALSFDGSSVRMTRRSDSGAQLVVWSLRDGKWRRWSAPPTASALELQDQWLRSQQLQGGELGQLQMLDGVSAWQVYFFRGNSWSNAQSSGDVTPASPAASVPARVQLPSGVRLVLRFADGSGLSGSLTRDLTLGPP